MFYLTGMEFSDCTINIFEFIYFLKKCKQTAEISWLFFWDVKISKKCINKKFVPFYRDVKTYLNLGGPLTQCEISCLPDIHCLLSSQNWNGKSLFEKFNWFYFSDAQSVLHQLDSSYNPAQHCQNFNFL